MPMSKTKVLDDIWLLIRQCISAIGYYYISFLDSYMAIAFKWIMIIMPMYYNYARLGKSHYQQEGKVTSTATSLYIADIDC